MATQLEDRAPTTVDQQIGAEIRAWLGRRGWSQRWLAQQLNVAPMQVSRRLRGETPLDVRELFAVAQALDITLGQLLGNDLVNEKNPHLVSGEGSRGRTSGYLVAGDGFEPSTSGL